MEENSGNRIGRTIWTVWGYLSGAVARYLRPEVTNEANQNVSSRSDETDLKSTVNKLSSDLKSDNSKTEEENKHDSDKSTAENKCSLSQVRMQVASVQWENTDVVKDDSKVELHVDATKKQTHHFAVWSTTDNRESISDETNSNEHNGKALAEKENLLSENLTAKCEYKESETAQELEETGQIGQKHGNIKDKEESDQSHDDPKFAFKEEVSDNANRKVQTELCGQDKQEQKMEHEETGGFGDFEDANEYFFEEKEKTKSDVNQGIKSQVEDLLPQQEYSTEESDGLSKPEELNLVEKYSEIAVLSKTNAETMMLETEPQTEGKEEDEECDANHEDENYAIKKDLDKADIMVHSELHENDVQQEKQISITDHRDTETFAGFKPADECLIGEMEKNVVDPEKMKEEETEKDEDQEPESKVHENEKCAIKNKEKMKIMDKYLEEMLEGLKDVDDLMLAPRQEGNIDSEQDYVGSVETLQRPSEKISEKNIPNDETELKLTKAVDPIFYSNEDTPENTPETGSPVVKAEGLFSDQIVCKFPGEFGKAPEVASDLGDSKDIKSNLHELQTFEEQHLERESKTVVTGSVEYSETPKALEEAVEREQDIETQIKSLGAAESGKFTGHVKFGPELIDETMETEISSEDKEVIPFETESELSIITNVNVQPHELQEFTEAECKSSQGTISTFIECLGNSTVTEKTEYAAEERPDAKPVLTKSLNPEEFLEEPVDLLSESERCTEEQEILDADVVKTALDFVEKLTNQVLKEFKESKFNLQETEPPVAASAEEHCAAFVLDKENKLSETVDSNVEMEVETDLFKQTEQTVSSPESECLKQQTTTILSTGTDNLVSVSDDADKEEHNGVEKESQTEILDVNSECKECDPIEELEKAGQIEQNDGNIVECDQNLVDENSAMNREDQDVTGITIQTQEQQIDSTEHHFENLKDVDQKENKLSETVDSNVEMEVETDLFKQNEQTVSSPEFECLKQQTTTILSTGTDNLVSVSDDTDKEEHKEVEKESQTEILDVNSKCKERKPVEELEKAGQIEQNDGNNEENLENENCAMNREDQDITGAIFQSQEQQIDITEHHFDENLKSIVAQKCEENTENDEGHKPELQAPADAVVLEEQRTLLSERVEIKVEMKLETISREVEQNDENISSPEGETIDGRHKQIQKVISGKTVLSRHEELMKVSKPAMKIGESSSLDFTVQKSRIAVKNPHVRPPKDPRKLLSKTSVQPFLPKPAPSSQSVQITSPCKGVIGFKLPGLGAGLPVLRKTEFGKKARDEVEKDESTLQPQQKSAAVSEDSVKQEQAPTKPKWTPPRHPGMGGPMMMAELKNKLKKPVNE